MIVLTVPQKPIQADPDDGIHAVLSMPFSGYDLISRIHAVQRSSRRPRRPATLG